MRYTCDDEVADAMARLRREEESLPSYPLLAAGQGRDPRAMPGQALAAVLCLVAAAALVAGLLIPW